MTGREIGFWGPQRGSLLENGDIVLERNGREIVRGQYGHFEVDVRFLKVAERFGWMRTNYDEPTPKTGLTWVARHLPNAIGTAIGSHSLFCEGPKRVVRQNEVP